ncbi:MAG: ABC transporter permease [Planctomycetales bacterium]|nr:ABC transporter permease [Planctomycetales bacterium]
MRFTSLVWKNLIRRPARSALTLTALATAIAAVVALVGISQGFTRSFAGVYEAHHVDVVVSRQGTSDRLSSSVDASYLPSIEALEKVALADGVLFETLSFEEEGVYGIPTMGIRPDSWLLQDYQVVDQKDIASAAGDVNVVAPGELGEPRTLMLGVNLADRLGKRAGERVNLFDEPYLISEVFRSSSNWENGSMILPLATLQQLTDRDGQFTYINVVLAKPLSAAEVAAAIKAIQALDGKLSPLATKQFVETDTRMQLAGAMAWMTSIIALLIGSIATLNTMLTSVLERTREIGILRAIGWTKRRVISMILLESCGLALAASVLGSTLAYLITWALSRAPIVNGMLSPSIDGPVLIQGLVLGLGIGLLGAALPAWRAAQLQPTEAFREF